MDKFNFPEKESHTVVVELTGDDIALAIDAYLVSHGVCIRGPRTIVVNGDLCRSGQVLVDPSGSVVYNGDNFTFRTA